MKPGALIKGKVEDLAFGGEGILKIDGAVIFVPYVIPGEEVEVSIVQAKKSFYRAKLVRVLEPSPSRVEPVCPYFGICGGCQYQHIDYTVERNFKEKQLSDLLQRVGQIASPDIRPMHFSQPYNYRNRITVHQEHGRVGFRDINGQNLVDIKECAIASREVNKKLEKLRQSNPRRPHYSVRANAVAGEAFHQTNQLMGKVLLERVCSAVSEGVDSLLEGYAGVGFFTHELAKRIPEIIAIESNFKAVEEAKKAPESAKVKWVSGTVEEHFPHLRAQLKGSRVVCLLDPPREGLSEIVRRDLLDMSFEKIVYLSCNPATLARDLKALRAKWEPEFFETLDMFPRTAHLECLTGLKPKV